MRVGGMINGRMRGAPGKRKQKRRREKKRSRRQMMIQVLTATLEEANIFKHAVHAQTAAANYIRHECDVILRRFILICTKRDGPHQHSLLCSGKRFRLLSFGPSKRKDSERRLVCGGVIGRGMHALC